MSFNCIK